VAADVPWTAHEAEVLAWLRLRAALGQALGVPQPRRVAGPDAASAPERPPSLASCAPTCLRRVAPLLQRQGLLSEAGRDAWTIPAPPPTGVEACWNLIPGFHGRWGSLWDLRTLDEQCGARPFGAASGELALRSHDGRVAGSRTHRRNRRPAGPPAPPPGERLRGLEAEGWLMRSPEGLRLSGPAQDAVMLLRLVLGARFHVPPEALERLGKLRPPPRPKRLPGSMGGPN
jgi:hypothetical protein